MAHLFHFYDVSPLANRFFPLALNDFLQYEKLSFVSEQQLPPQSIYSWNLPISCLSRENYTTVSTVVSVVCNWTLLGGLRDYCQLLDGLQNYWKGYKSRLKAELLGITPNFQSHMAPSWPRNSQPLPDIFAGSCRQDSTDAVATTHRRKMQASHTFFPLRTSSTSLQPLQPFHT